MITGYRKPGDIELRDVLLVTSDNSYINISNIISEINVYEDLMEHYVTCEMVISDAVGLLSGIKNGFTGTEMLCLSYRNKTDNSDDEFVNYVFGIYEVSDRQRTGEYSETYIMSGVSIEYYWNCMKIISNGFNTTNTNMIKSIFQENFKKAELLQTYQSLRSVFQTEIVKDLVTDASLGTQKLIIPTLHVDAAINFIANEADSENGIPLFFFFETSKGYNFRNISEIVANASPKETYTYYPFSINRFSTTEIDLDSRRIESFIVHRQNNIIDNIMGGLFKSTTMNVDLLNKEKVNSNFDYQKRHRNFPKLQGKIPGEVIEQTTNLYVTTKTDNKKLNEIYADRASYKHHIFNTSVSVTIPGDSTLSVGDVIELRIPPSSEISELKDEEQIDKYLSGNFIITKVRNKMGGLTGSQYSTVLECCKDGIKGE